MELQKEGKRKKD